MNLILKFEKTVFLILKLTIIVLVFSIFFSCFSIQIPQLITINRTSIISMTIFFISILNLIKIFGGFKIGQTQFNELKNTLILGTILADLITYLTTVFMGVSYIQYIEFSTKFSSPLQKPSFSIFLKHYFLNRILPSLLLLILVILIQIICLNVWLKYIQKLYFKFNPPKNSIIIFKNESDLIPITSKIIKNLNMWKLTCFIRFDNENVVKLIKKNEVVFFINVPKLERSTLLDLCYKFDKTIYIYPDITDVLIHSFSKFMIDDSMMLSSNNFNLNFEQAFFKRLTDIVFATLILIITSPIMLLAAILIKLNDGGPIFFKQKRLTKNNKEFNLLKFRSMKLNAEEETGVTLAKQNDIRITSVGKFLRRFRIDELPQLINILIGDLSLVGPRPERSEYFEKFESYLPEFKYRLKVKAGLTGLAQIAGKYNTNPKDKLTLDLIYIQKYSIWLDIKIILRTLIVFLKSDSTEGETKINKTVINFIKKNIIK